MGQASSSPVRPLRIGHLHDTSPKGDVPEMEMAFGTTFSQVRDVVCVGESTDAIWARATSRWTRAASAPNESHKKWMRTRATSIADTLECKWQTANNVVQN